MSCSFFLGFFDPEKIGSIKPHHKSPDRKIQAQDNKKGKPLL
jgi:hypothetical protein